MKTILRLCSGYQNKHCVTILTDVHSGYLEEGHTDQNIIDETPVSGAAEMHVNTVQLMS